METNIFVSTCRKSAYGQLHWRLLDEKKCVVPFSEMNFNADKACGKIGFNSNFVVLVPFFARNSFQLISKGQEYLRNKQVKGFEMEVCGILISQEIVKLVMTCR